MRKLIYAVAILGLAACAKKETENAPVTTTTSTARPAATAAQAEKTYPMTATIVSRDPAKNSVNLDNKEVPGEMGAMKMDYELRGAKAGALPPNGTAVVVTVHDRNGEIWVSDVKPQK